MWEKSLRLRVMNALVTLDCFIILTLDCLCVSRHSSELDFNVFVHKAAIFQNQFFLLLVLPAALPSHSSNYK